MDSILLIGTSGHQYEDLLRRLGYLVINEGEDPDEALIQIFRNRIIDLAIIDTEEVKEYCGLLEFFQAEEATKTLGIILLSEKSTPEVPAKVKSSGMVEVIKKPVSVGLMASKIAGILRLRKMKGVDPAQAHMAEMNAALRDFNDKISRDLDEARDIQLNTLPEVIPFGDSYDIAYSYEPLEELGGDWFFIQEEEDGKVTFIQADVTGHGLPAAFIGGWIKLAMRAAHEVEPHQRLAHMNGLLTPQLPDGRFITICCGLYEPSTGVVQLARGGHPPCIVYRQATGKLERLQASGFAIGFFEESEYVLESCTLNKGDLIVLVTDGIIEAMNMDNEFFNPEGVERSLAETSADMDAQAVMEKILEDFETFTGGRMVKDDVTVIVLKRI